MKGPQILVSLVKKLVANQQHDPYQGVGAVSLVSQLLSMRLRKGSELHEINKHRSDRIIE